MIDKDYINLKKELCLQNQEFEKWGSVVLKLVIIEYFENIRLSPTINILNSHIHEICEPKFRRINYRKNTVEMTLFQKYEVFY